MHIRKLGEFGLIERFRRRIRTDSTVIKGSGDDCAVIKFDKNNYLLFTCDMLVEGVDFLSRENPYLIGRKSIAVSVSDIAACAGVPRYCVVSLGVPGNKSVKFTDTLFKGMLDLARKYKINIVGGDLSRAEKLTIDVSMLGVVRKERLVLRKGAKAGDIIFVTGALGGSIRGKHLQFTPRLKEARFLTENFKVHAMIDISDGLVQDLSHILKQAGLGAVLYEESIPQDKQARNLKEALYMGEDFELLFTLSRPDARKLCLKDRRNFKAIGETRPPGYGLKSVGKDGRERNIAAGGFRHF